MEGHIGEAVEPLAHARLGHAQVVLIEEPRIRQARREDLLVALKDRRAVIGGFGIGDGDKALDPARARVTDGEELLMLFHRGLKHLGRQAKEGLVDLAREHHGPFDKARNLGQKPFVLNDFEARGKGLIGGVMPDRLGAFFGAEDHMGLLELGLVILKPRDLDIAF